jgi:hypothetical protein
MPLQNFEIWTDHTLRIPILNKYTLPEIEKSRVGSPAVQRSLDQGERQHRSRRLAKDPISQSREGGHCWQRRRQRVSVNDCNSWPVWSVELWLHCYTTERWKKGVVFSSSTNSSRDVDSLGLQVNVFQFCIGFAGPAYVLRMELRPSDCVQKLIERQ